MYFASKADTKQRLVLCQVNSDEGNGAPYVEKVVVYIEQTIQARARDRRQQARQEARANETTDEREKRLARQRQQMRERRARTQADQMKESRGWQRNRIGSGNALMKRQMKESRGCHNSL